MLLIERPGKFIPGIDLPWGIEIPVTPGRPPDKRAC